jgi:toxin ParE1/3/4
MSGGFVVRPRARRDVAEIAGYIGADNLEASDRFIDEVHRAFELLSRMPQMGSARRFRREALKGLRLWRVPHFASYLIIYRPIHRGIEVLRVLHGARHIEQLLGN